MFGNIVKMDGQHNPHLSEEKHMKSTEREDRDANRDPLTGASGAPTPSAQGWALPQAVWRQERRPEQWLDP